MKENNLNKQLKQPSILKITPDQHILLILWLKYDLNHLGTGTLKFDYGLYLKTATYGS